MHAGSSAVRVRLAAFAPSPTPEVRWDSGVVAGSVIGTDFDPMLAKVIAYGPTRREAAGRLALALARTHLGGVVTNRDFLVTTLRTPEFLAGDTPWRQAAVRWLKLKPSYANGNFIILSD